MAGRGDGGGGARRRQVLLPPITFMFKLLQDKKPVKFYLYEQLEMWIEGFIRGFDEYMNVVIDKAVEVVKVKGPNKTDKVEKRRKLGQILLKGDNVSIIQDLTS